MNKDGSNLVCLDDGDIYNPVTYGEYIYYLKDENDTKILCRIPLLGGESEEVAEFSNSTYRFYPYKNHIIIYYSDKEKLISLDPSTREQNVMLYGSLQSFCIEDDLLYLIPTNTFSDKNIYVMPINPKPQTTIDLTDQTSLATFIRNKDIKCITFPYSIYAFNVKNSVIYASSYITASWQDTENNNDGIWRVNNDGSDFRQIYTGNASQIQLLDNTLYFSDDNIIYSMDLNGNNITSITDMTASYNIN